MTNLAPLPFGRRDLLKGAGALVVGFAVPGTRATLAQAAAGSAVKPPLAADQLDSWIAVHQDGGISAFFGKMDMGQGVDVAIAQIVAEELDVVRPRHGRHGRHRNLAEPGRRQRQHRRPERRHALRNAAAEARRVLVAMAAARLNVPVDTERRRRRRRRWLETRLSYGELIGDRYFDVALQWNGKLGNDLVAIGKAKPKRRRVQDRRPAGAAQRHRRQGLRPQDYRHRHQGPRHGPRPHDPAASPAPCRSPSTRRR